MNFTREPIIETVITPREGCKLAVRSSKGNGQQEDYFVDAVEVVSFGHSFFFRSQERPKSFLVPVSDYEVLELKETRMVLKSVSTDRAIKIGGGREGPPRPHREPKAPKEPIVAEEPREEEPSESRLDPRSQERPPERQSDRKRDRRRRGRRGRDRNEAGAQEERPKDDESAELSSAEPVPAGEEGVKAPSFISKLFPPPTTLIKDSISRYKAMEISIEEPFFDKPESASGDNDQELEAEE